MIEFTVTKEGYSIKAVVERQAQDLLIQLIGGDVLHYGVVTTVDKYGELQTIALPSRPEHFHQEGLLTELLGHKIASHLQNNAFIVSGVHVNNISDAQMHVAPMIVLDLAAQITAWLKYNQVEAPEEIFAPSKNH
jgi:gallate decarboxylase subunit D